MTGEALTVGEVQGRIGISRFLRLPRSLYRGDPGWVPPLDFELRQRLDWRRNPALRGRELRLWLARDGGRDVGRIAAHLDPYEPACGCFGFLDAVDDPRVFAALLKAAETWLHRQGARLVQGPFNTTINEECGLLVDGFATRPMVMMGHAPAYAGRHVEACGYSKAQDLLAYRLTLGGGLEPWSARVLEHGARQGLSVAVRPMDIHRREDIAALVEVFNDAWADNWGFRAATLADGEALVRQMAPLLRKGHALMALVDGEPAGMQISIANLNEAIADFDGRLWPFNWLKLLWRIKVAGVRSVRIPLTGVRRRFHGAGGAAVLAALLRGTAETAQRYGYTEAEMSWVLEENRAARRLLEAGGFTVHKTYRLYQRRLPEPGQLDGQAPAAAAEILQTRDAAGRERAGIG